MKLTREADNMNVNLDKSLAWSAAASHSNGSVPDEVREQAEAWFAVYWLLQEVVPEMSGLAVTGKDCALAAIGLLAGRNAGMQPPNNQPNSDHVAVTSAELETRLTGERRVHAENYHADTINDLEMALDSARRGYWKQCAVRAATASKSAAKWNHAADIWLEWKAKPSAQQ